MMRLLTTLVSVLALSWVGHAQAPARNVILFLADAAGIPVLHAASLHAYGDSRKLFVQRMPHIGLSDTATASEYVTDSAAGMTAIVTGQRTHNGVLGQGPDAARGVRDGTPLKTILEHAEEHGLATGIVSNDAITGATPAALYAKVNDRDRTADIFRQAFDARGGDGVEVLIGAGRRAIERALGEQGATLAAVARTAGRPVLDSLEAVPADSTRAVVLMEDENFDLSAAVAIARRVLSRNARGYFLMVESDAHTDSIRKGLDRVAGLDRVIEQTAAAVGPDTLVIFTADHSFDLRVHAGLRAAPLLTGAAAERGGGMEHVRLPHVRMDDTHTGEEVLVAAQGPGADRVRGYLANTDIFSIMLDAFGWTAQRR